MHRFEDETKYRIPSRGVRLVTVKRRTDRFVFFNDGSRKMIFEGFFDDEPSEYFHFAGKRVYAAWQN